MALKMNQIVPFVTLLVAEKAYVLHDNIQIKKPVWKYKKSNGSWEV